jgi:DNA invertase Pin-like site-specific DNA recombinase
MSERMPIVRCAIYTRKSTEEGLEQTFNTLQAQRESAEAYVLSRKGDGWQALPTVYDDGGFSGASLDRPALKQLLADMDARRIDCVLVYKVDRLSRSLLDFTRLLSLFDKRGVSFVSVTQDFNTGTSMGRLTLNILLSFAQFEREISSERTRDKLSAARRKGKWIGGIPVLGYDVAPEGGRLVVNESEAEQVRSIFSICLRCSTVTQALAAVQAGGWAAKRWTSARGKEHGGQLLGMSTLYALLTNVLYRGDVFHKGVVYAGEHPAIVSRELWLEVNEKLKLSRTTRPQNARAVTVLGGVVKCGQCRALLTVSFTRRGGEKHVYYVCRAGKKQQPPCPQRPVGCCDLDDSLRERLDQTGRTLDHASELKHVIHRVSYHSATRCVSVELRDGTQFDYSLPAPVRPGVMRTERDGKNQRRTPRISRVLALAHRFETLLAKGTVRTFRELAELGHVSRPRLSQIMQLIQLAPDIQEQLLFLPPSVRGPDLVFERHLRSIADVMDWDEQRQLFRSLLQGQQEPARLARAT